MSLTLMEDIGIEIENGIFLTVFKSGQQLPCKQEGLFFSVASEEQKHISICVRQGEFRKAENNTYLGEIDFNMNALSNRLSPVIKVDFFVSAVGRLLVRGMHLKKHEYQYLSIDLEFPPRRFFTEREMLEDAEFSKFARLAIKARKIIKSYHQMAKGFHRNREDRVYISMYEDIQRAEKALETGDFKEIKDCIERLRESFEEITFISSAKQFRANDL